MENINFLKDYYEQRFPIFEHFLGLPDQTDHQQITKLLNLPFHFYKKQTLTAPFFTIINLPDSNYQDRIECRPKCKTYLKTRRKMKEREKVLVACLGNNIYETEEPLLFECSDESLNLELKPRNSIKQSYGSFRKNLKTRRNVQKNQISTPSVRSKDNLTVFAFTGQEGENTFTGESDSQILLSTTTTTTSSSSSSTREYYLPAATGSADTIKVADAIGRENIYPPQISKTSSIANNEAWFQNNAIYTHDQKQIGQKGAYWPTISNNDLTKNNSYSVERINKRTHADIISDIEGRNPIMTKFHNLKKAPRDKNQLSVMVKKSDSTVPLITIDKLCDKVLMHLKMHGINRDSGIFLQGRIKINEEQTNTENNVITETNPKQMNINQIIPGPKMPTPLDWVKEIKENKCILQQDVIENESINLSAQSSLSTLSSCNRNTLKDKSKTENEVFKSKEMKRASNENSKNEFINKLTTEMKKNNNILGNGQEFNLSNSDISCGENNLDTRVNLVPSNGNAVSLPRQSDKKIMDSGDTRSKYKKLSGFFDLSSQKPLITKLFIQSDVVIEGSGSGLEDELGGIHKDRKKFRPFERPQYERKFPQEDYVETEEPFPSKHNLNILHEVRAHTTSQENGKELSENSFNDTSNACVYTESLFSSKNHFQKLCDMFDLKNTNYVKNKTGANTAKDTYTYFLEDSSLHKRKTLDKITPVTEIPIIETRTKILNNRVLQPEVLNLNKSAQHIESEERNREVNLKAGKPILREESTEDCINDHKKEENLAKTTLTEKEEDKPLNEYMNILNLKVLTCKQGQLTLENGQPALLYDELGFPYTDLKGRILKNNIGIPVLHVKSYNDLITNNITVYDSKKISIHNSDFDPSTKPQITTIAKVTDQVGNPVSLYNNMGLPLTDEDGLLLHDYNGEILMTLDSRFFPLCCKNGTCIYLRNGLTWLSQRYKYIVTTQNKVNSEMKEDMQAKSLHGFRNSEQNTLEKNVSFPFVNSSSHKNKIDFTSDSPMEKKAVSTQYEEKVLRNFNIINKKQNNNIEYEAIQNGNNNKSKSTPAEVILNLLYKKLVEKNTQPPIRNNHSMFLNSSNALNNNVNSNNLIYDVEGNCLNDKHGYPLYSKYGEPLLLYDKYGFPISDSFGRPIFDANGKQIVRNSNNNKTANKLIHDSYPFQGTFLQPERPYCEQPEESITESMAAKEFDNSLSSYQESEPLLKIIERNDIRAWDLHNEVPSSVKSVYSLPSQTYRPRVTHSTKSFHYLQHNNGQKNYATKRQSGNSNFQQRYFSPEGSNTKTRKYELIPQNGKHYASPEGIDYYQYESETVDSADDYEDAYDYVGDKNIKYIHLAPKGQSASYYVNSSYQKANNPYYMEY